VNAAYRLVSFIQNAQRTLDVTSELLGDPTLKANWQRPPPKASEFA
jgi:hypothetical protein